MDIIEQLKRDEGLRTHVYIDTVGKRTIGYGHNLDANPLPFDVTNGITIEQAQSILQTDVAHMKVRLSVALPWVELLDDERHGVLINMSFNMGVPGLLKFHNTLNHVQHGFYKDASRDMANSTWYTQVGVRARRLAVQMELGIWQ